MNLLEETKEIMAENGKTGEDIIFIGSRDGQYGMTWAEFKTVADVEYDEDYGGQEVGEDLVICFSDKTWLERAEYDGREWWAYKICPSAPPSYLPIEYLVGGSSWATIAEINGEQEKA